MTVTALDQLRLHLLRQGWLPCSSHAVPLAIGQGCWTCRHGTELWSEPYMLRVLTRISRDPGGAPLALVRSELQRCGCPSPRTQLLRALLLGGAEQGGGPC